MNFALTASRLTWIILGLSLSASLVGTGIIAHRDIRALQEDNQSLAVGLSRQLARAGHLALLANDYPELKEIARSVLNTDPILGRVLITRANGQAVVDIAHPPRPTHRLDSWAARAAQALGRQKLAMTYSAQIPPAGEGSLLDPFGTPRADIGKTTLTLSSSEYTNELASSFYAAALIWLLLFLVLTSTGYGIAWVAALPMLRLGKRLNALTGVDDESLNPPSDFADIERSLTVIGQRLSRSEDEARVATEALHGQSQQLELARQHARNAARMRADLVAGMSHELRTPLTAILGHSDLLARSALDKHQQDYVATVRKSARNLLRLIDDVLEWSGIEAGKANFNDVGFNLAEIVEDTIDLLAPLAFEKDLELIHMIYQDVPVRLRGDPQRLQQILTNLVSNAIKFTREGSVTIRVMLEDEDSDSATIRASVADTGPGITEEAQLRLFDMYERLDNAAAIGSGLGLAISKRLLKMMGGEISVDSQPGRGSDFQITLPLKKALHRAQKNVPWSDLQGQHVWIQDDNGTARLSIAHHLEAWGTKVFEMDTRHDLQACLEDDATSLQPDLAIIGLRAAEVEDTGLRAMLAACQAAKVPVLTLVTSIDPEVHSALESAGANVSLAKSINRLQLYRQLCDLVGIKQQSAQEDRPPLAEIQCLIADNSAAARGYLATLLASLGAGVAQAEDGKAAVNAWRKGSFPLVLLDEQMPGLPGTEAAREIRQIATAANQPVLIGITADSRASVRTRLMSAGMDACLVKPFDETQLLRCLEPLLPRLNLDSAVAKPNIQRADHLVADPKLALLLEQELPAQFDAFKQALDLGDAARAQAEIHTLHGTAAFYALSELRTAAMQIEKTLQADEYPKPDELQHLQTSVNQAIAGLKPRPAN